MSIELSAENIADADDAAQCLCEPAARNQRSMQSELLAILEAAVREESGTTPGDLLLSVQSLGLHTPSEATEIVRTIRDMP